MSAKHKKGKRTTIGLLRDPATEDIWRINGPDASPILLKDITQLPTENVTYAVLHLPENYTLLSVLSPLTEDNPYLCVVGHARDFCYRASAVPVKLANMRRMIRQELDTAYWVRLHHEDGPSYHLADLFEKSQQKTQREDRIEARLLENPHMPDLLRQHPVWPALCFFRRQPAHATPDVLVDSRLASLSLDPLLRRTSIGVLRDDFTEARLKNYHGAVYAQLDRSFRALHFAHARAATENYRDWSIQTPMPGILQDPWRVWLEYLRQVRDSSVAPKNGNLFSLLVEEEQLHHSFRPYSLGWELHKFHPRQSPFSNIQPGVAAMMYAVRYLLWLFPYLVEVSRLPGGDSDGVDLLLSDPPNSAGSQAFQSFVMLCRERARTIRSQLSLGVADES